MDDRTLMTRLFSLLFAPAMLLLSSGCGSGGDECDPASFGERCNEGRIQVCQRRSCSDALFSCTKSLYVAEQGCGSGYACMVEGAQKAECVPAQTSLACVADPAITGPSSTNGPSRARAILRDMDDDGIVDLVTVSDDSANLEVRRGKGDATFDAARSVELGAPIYGLVAGDFDGDGLSDVVVFEDRAFALLRANDRSLGFDPPDVTMTNSEISGLRVADFDADGADDLVVITPKSIDVYMSRKGRFVAKDSLGTEAEDRAFADLDGDGRVDIGVVSMFDYTFTVWVGRGDGTFDAPVTLDTGKLPSNLAVADLDADGIMDVVIGSFSMGTVEVHHGRGGGVFDAATKFAAMLSPSSLEVTDVDADGRADLVIGTDNRHSFVVFRGKGDATFESQPAAFDPPARTWTSSPSRISTATEGPTCSCRARAGSPSFAVRASERAAQAA
ncbi:MAG: VCBS repeat-containing protein [Polyangiaceae bacterium]